MAVSFVSADTAAHFALIEKRNGVQVPREAIQGFEPEQVLPVVSADQAAGGVKGRRPSKKDKLRAAGLLPPLA
jgi:ATP-dependent RNA helicase RhlE